LVNIVATRLTPGTDLLEGIEKLVHEHDIRAGVVISAVASLQRLHLRMGGATPEQSEYIEREGFFEVVSVTGTVSTTGVHLHISVSTSDGSVIGGHLREGNIVRTTAEIAIANEPDLVFARGLDSRTGWEELEVFEVVTPSGAPEPVV
jgi:predicted DNA-binding protein with PD1-like motif